MALAQVEKNKSTEVLYHVFYFIIIIFLLKTDMILVKVRIEKFFHR